MMHKQKSSKVESNGFHLWVNFVFEEKGLFKIFDNIKNIKKKHYMHIFVTHGNTVLQIMVHTEFNDDPDRFPYNVNDNEDINVILNVRKTHQSP